MYNETRRTLFEAQKQAVIDHNEDLPKDKLVPVDKSYESMMVLVPAGENKNSSPAGSDVL